MRATGIQVFIPSKDYEVSKAFYQAMGFASEYVSDALTLFQNNDCKFFLQRFYNRELAENFVLQLGVECIEDAQRRLALVSSFGVKFSDIKDEPWGKVIYLWGPSGELWQLTEFKHTTK